MPSGLEKLLVSNPQGEAQWGGCGGPGGWGEDRQARALNLFFQEALQDAPVWPVPFGVAEDSECHSCATSLWTPWGFAESLRAQHGAKPDG